MVATKILFTLGLLTHHILTATGEAILQESPTPKTPDFTNVTPDCTPPQIVTSGERSLEVYNSLFMVSQYFNIDIADGATIVWDTVHADVGNNFNQGTGEYTIPFSGTYRFTVSKYSIPSLYAPFWILVNNERYFFSALMKPNELPITCVTMDIELSEGDVVAIQNVVDTMLKGSHLDTRSSYFTGHLLD